MAHLLSALRATEHIRQTAIVEIGSYRGETTRCLAQATSRHVFAIDPYIGYGGAGEDYRRFKSRTDDLPNVTHLKATSGSAARAWKDVPISLLFIDAVHDYVNVHHDISIWKNLVVGGGFVALHDTDDPRFAGSRRAVFEAARQFEMWAHPAGMVMLRKPDNWRGRT